MRLLSLAFFLLPGLALAAPVKVSSISASSTQKPEPGGVNYEAANMISDTGFKYWAEGDGSAGLGTRIDVKFDGTHELVGVAIWNGSFGGEGTFKNSNRIKTLEFEFKAGTFGSAEKETVEMESKYHRAVYKFEKPHSADQLKMFVRAVYDGDAYNETGISYIQFLDKNFDERIYADSVTASSEGEGFAAFGAADGLVDTAWCVAEGKGKGETLEIKLPKGSSLGKLQGHFGLNMEGQWEKNARPKTVTVEAGGKKFDWKLNDTPDVQTLELGSVAADSVKITLGAIQNGRIYKDACLSEIQFIAD